MEKWLLFQDPRFALQFQYPNTATDGEPVERVETQGEGMLRVHLLAPKSREVYFEVSKYDLMMAEEEYHRHKKSLPQQFDSLTISDLHRSKSGSLPAYEYEFEWDSGRRVVILVESNGATYRMLYNPNFPINLQILLTVEWLNFS